MKKTKTPLLGLACATLFSVSLSALAVDNSGGNPPKNASSVLEALAQAEAKKKEIRAQKVFEASLEQRIPMAPNQIRKFKVAVDDTQAAIRSDIPPKMLNTSRQLSIEPGAPSPLIMTHPGYVTTLLFVDSTGKHWPITSHTAGQPSWYSVNRPEGLEPGNMLTISPLTNHVNTNILVTLQDLPTPIVLRVKTNFDQKSKKSGKMDSLVTFRLQKLGPFADIPKIGNSVESPLNVDVMSFLNDTPPSGARPVRLSPKQSGASAWTYNDKLYLRSVHPAKWPAAWSITSGSGDLRVYELPITSSLMLYVDGRPVSFSVN